jgi:hypothetical protein
MGMGAADDATKIFRNIRININKWNAMLNSLAGAGDADYIKGEMNFISGPTPSSTEETESLMPTRLQHGPVQDQSNPALFKEFYTLTMAELFLKQGHLETAREILKNIVQKKPADFEAEGKLKEIELMLAGRQSVLGNERCLSVLNELERWIRKIKKGV